MHSDDSQIVRDSSISRHQSLEDKQVTIRHRDSMNQIRVPIATLTDTIAAKLSGENFLVIPEGGKIWKEEKKS